jgi:hypothetical protein
MLKQRNWLYDIEGVKNRPDKSILEIYSMYPEELLRPDVASPELVKHLALNLSFANFYMDPLHYENSKIIRNGRDCKCCIIDSCQKCNWNEIYTDTLCKDLIYFTNLETLYLSDVNLSNELWIQFAQNSKHLKEIEFNSEEEVYKGYSDKFEFDGQSLYGDDLPPKNAALDAIIKIPTLKVIKFNYINLPYFPKGPSNIEELHLNDIVDYTTRNEYSISPWEKFNLVKNFDISNHQNLKKVYIDRIDQLFSELNLEKLKKLEELHFDYDNREVVTSFQTVIEKISNLKIFHYSMCFDKTDPFMKKLIKDQNLPYGRAPKGLIFSNLEHVEIKVRDSPENLDLRDAHKHLVTVLQKQCPKLKTFNLKYKNYSLSTIP